MYGNYCGPYWSDGKIQASVVGSSPAVDELDQCCKEHDSAYAVGRDLRTADFEFATCAAQFGLLGKTFGAIVWTQGMMRSHDITTMSPNNNNKQKKSLRGAVQASKPQNPRNARNNMAVTTAAPVSIGSTIRAIPPQVSRSNDGSRVTGRDFIGTVEGQGVSTFGLGKSALLSPAYFATTTLGNIARSFERYRWNKLRVHFVPKVATTAVGQIVLCSQRSVSEPGLQPEAGTFLQRAMSQGNAVFSPLWVGTFIDIDCSSSDWKLVDPSTTSDIDDCVHEELQVYTQISVAAQVGYLIAEYDISFKEVIYQPHSSTLPFSTGPGYRVSLTDGAAVNGVGDDWVLSETSTTFTSAVNGTIYRAVLDLQGCSAGTGATLTNELNVITAYRTATITQTSAVSSFPLIGGSTIYMVVIGSSLYCYTSLEAAVNGNGTGQLFFRTATTTAGTYLFDLAQVRQGSVTIAQVQ